MKPHPPTGKFHSIKITIFRFLTLMCLTAALIFASVPADASIVGPYSVDTNTLHLWHLDELTVPAVDAAPDGTNLMVLGGTSSLGNASSAGFGTAFGSVGSFAGYIGPRAYSGNTVDNTLLTYANTNSGAFTMEAIVRIDFDPTLTYTVAPSNQPLYIITGENQSGQHRPFQWAIMPKGLTAGGTPEDTTKLRMRFLAGGSSAPNSHVVVIPESGPDAIVQGNWYHVAVTFTGGSPGTIVQYWTLLDSSRVQANVTLTLLGAASGTLNNLVPLATGAPCFMLGNQGRNAPNGGFQGLIDEVRISNIARPATGMMFASVAVVVSQDPVSQSVAVGQPASFSVTAAGSPPLYYQWRTNGIAIPEATNSTYNLLSVQLSDAAGYDVVVTNSTSAATSAVATLTVRVPLNLTWIGTSGFTWDTSTVNWDSTSDLAADSAFTFGDHVRFDDNGSASPTLDVSAVFTPSSVVVSNETLNYILTTSGSGGIAGSSGLTKQGAGTLYLDIDNTYTGATDIREGTVVLGVAGTRGSLGTGPITNQATVRVDRTSTLVINSAVAGNGELINDNTGNVTLNGTNTMNGKVTVNKGTVTFGPAALGGTTNITVVGFGVGTGITLSGGTAASDMVFDGQTSGPDNRVNVVVAGGSNVWNGPILLSGVAAAILNVGAGASFEVNGPVTGGSYSDKFTLRGGGDGILRGTVTLPNGALQKTDVNQWVVASTGSSYLYTIIRGGVVKLGNHDALAPDGFLYFEQSSGTLDLAGFNQTVAGITNNTVATRVIANSSTNSDSRLTIAAPAPGPWQYDGVIADSTGGGTRKVGLTLSTGTQTLTGNSTYSGDTTVSAGTLALGGNGQITNSTPINLLGGATLDVSTRNDATLTLHASQTLKGNGTVVGNLAGTGTVSPGASIGILNVNGNATLNGTTFMEVNIAGGTNDQLNVTGTLTYGGILAVTNIGGGSYSAGQAFKLFNASSYGGVFSSFNPSVPAFGLKWDTSTLAADGTLRIDTIPTYPTNVTATATGGGTVQVDWPASHTGWTLQMQTNAINVGISTNWANVAGSASTNQMFLPLNSGTGCVFFRMVYP